ncbi:hypothetical protein H0H87_009692, partial [Tephrocybe sp. NHM501043]
MPPADNNPTTQPTVAPDGKKPLSKHLLDRFKRESSSAAGAPATRSREIATGGFMLPLTLNWLILALDVKPSALKRLSGVFKPTKSMIVTSAPTTRPRVNLA